jgi:hypothetical protein
MILRIGMILELRKEAEILAPHSLTKGKDGCNRVLHNIERKSQEIEFDVFHCFKTQREPDSSERLSS